MPKSGTPRSAHNEWCSHHPRAKDKPPTRQVAWYRRERAKWIAHLGGKCAVCGATEELEFDHDVPRDWRPEKKSRWQRLTIYIREIRAGKIKQVLCRVCNARKGYPDGQLELLDAAEERCKKEREKGPF